MTTATITADETTTPRFEYNYQTVNDLVVETEQDPKTGKENVKHILVQDEPIQASERFWTSLQARYLFSKNIFTYFNHSEVFDRISERRSNDRMRLCIERSKDQKGKPVNRLLAVSNPNKPLVVHDELQNMLERYDGQNISYSDGIVESTHTPRVSGNKFEVLGDQFENRFIMSTPIDGYGVPNIYLSLLRLICENGVVGYAKTFRSTLPLGKGNDDVSPSITRALEGFNNDEGFSAIRQRIEASGKSWLSVYEMTQLQKLITSLHSKRLLAPGDKAVKGTRIAGYLKGDRPEDAEVSVVSSPLLIAYRRMTGDPCAAYGLANLDSLNPKRQRTLPVNCTVYDAINFATEVATHYADPKGARKLQAFIGTTLADEYDMENTKDKFGEFADFLVDSKMTANLTGSEHAHVPEMN